MTGQTEGVALVLITMIHEEVETIELTVAHLEEAQGKNGEGWLVL